MLITRPPNATSFSLNPNNVRIFADSFPFAQTTFPLMVLRVKCDNQSYDIGKPPLSIDGGLYADMDISAYLKKHATVIPKPTFDGTYGLVQVHPLQPYSLESFVGNQDEFTTRFQHPDEYYVMKGGISESLLSALQTDNLDTFYLFRNQFMTWQPQSTPFMSVQPISLYYTPYANQDLSNCKLKTVISYQSGSPLEIISDPFTIQAYAVHEFNLSPVLLDNAMNVQSYSVSILSENDSPLCEAHHFHRMKGWHQANLVYRNSLGVFDSMSFPNPTTITADLEKDFPQGSFAIADNALIAEVKELYPPLLTTEFRRYLRELVLSEEVYWYHSGELTRISIATESIDDYSTYDTVHQSRIRVALPQNAYI